MGQNVEAQVSDLERWMQKYQSEGILRSSQLESVRLLLVAKSSRELDLQDIVGTHEFAHYNASLMRPDGSLATFNKQVHPHP